MNLNIFQAVNNIATALDDHFKRSPFVYKTTDEPNKYKPALPVIYKYVVPPEDKNDKGYPLRSPALAIVVESIEGAGADRKARISIQGAVCNPSTSEAETVTGNNETGYTFDGGTGYSQSGTYIDLYESALRFGEETANALGAISDRIRAENITITPPDIDLDDFPWATFIIHADLIYSASKRGRAIEVDMYL